MRRLLWRIGHRGAALLFFALLDLAYCGSLVRPQRPAPVALAYVGHVAPLRVWAALWGVAGAACLASAFMRRDRWGFTAAMGVKVLWGGLFVYGALLGVDRSWLQAIIWLCLAGWVGIISTWPEPPRTTPTEGEAGA